MIKQDDASNLIVKKLAGEISSAEEVELSNWLAQSESNQQEYDAMEKIWRNANREELTINVEAAWNKVDAKTKSKIITLVWNPWLRIAAVLTAVGFLGYFIFDALKVSKTHYLTAANEVKQVNLPDGSLVWLHENSALTVINDLDGKHRTVELDGLAFFEVSKDQAHPFVIETPKGKVEVLGTSFEVLAYKNNKEERVTVSTGKVKFSNKKLAKEVVLTANMQATFSSVGIDSSSNINANELISWTGDTLSFNNDNLLQVAEKISRHFNVKVVLANPKLNNCIFTGTFTKPKLKDVLHTICLATQVSYKDTEKHIVIEGEGCETNK
jgi:transmembrane sensor